MCSVINDSKSNFKIKALVGLIASTILSYLLLSLIIFDDAGVAGPFVRFFQTGFFLIPTVIGFITAVAAVIFCAFSGTFQSLIEKNVALYSFVYFVIVFVCSYILVVFRIVGP